jgi:uncharacterized membrane protein
MSLTGRAGTAITRQDVDGDGEPEIILANQRLKVELLTGIPAEEKEPGWRERMGTLFSKPKPPSSRYGKRFVWGGWIHNIESVPTRRRWFTNTVSGREHWDGIPEEFGEAVPMAKLEDGSHACLKMGVGEAIGRGLCLRGSLKLTKVYPWTCETRMDEAGTGIVTFTQQAATEHGYGYTYTKEFRLAADSAKLEITRTVANTGSQAIHSTWYSHGFWGQAGGRPDGDCWSTIPLQDLAGDNADVDTTLCRVTDLAPACYWGPVSAEQIAENWYASGYTPSREAFVSTFSERPAWFRVWTNALTYSCEPFVLLDLEPGETKAWTVTRAAVEGLDRVDGSGPTAAVAFGSTDPRWLEVSLSTYQPCEDIDVRIRFRRDGADTDLLDHRATVKACGPNWPARIRLERAHLPEATGLLQVTATNGGQTLIDTTRRIAPRTAGLPPGWLGAAKGKRAIVLGDVRRENETVRPQPATVYWDFALQRAGFEVTVLPIGEAAGEGVLADTDLVVVSGPVRMPGRLVGVLSSFVDQGGGLVVTGPLDLRPFEFSDLLPVTAIIADVVVQAKAPRDGTREFLDAPRYRYQLEAATSHSATAGIPFYPHTLQGVGRLQVVQPRDGAQTLVSYTGPDDLQPQVSSPALVVGTHGGGRVAVLASPVNWGTPQQWSIWSRLGEYHQQFLGQLGQWAAGPSQETDSQ